MTALYQTQDAISHCNEVAPLSENTAGVLVQNLYSIFTGEAPVEALGSLMRSLYLTNSANLGWYDCMEVAMKSLGV